VNLIRLYEDELDHLLCLEGTRGDKKAKPYDRKLLRLLEMNLIEFVSDDTVTLTGRGRNCVRHIRAQAIANSNQISVFLRCAVCLTELPANTSSREMGAARGRLDKPRTAGLVQASRVQCDAHRLRGQEASGQFDARDRARDGSSLALIAPQ